MANTPRSIEESTLSSLHKLLKERPESETRRRLEELIAEAREDLQDLPTTVNHLRTDEPVATASVNSEASADRPLNSIRSTTRGSTSESVPNRQSELDACVPHPTSHNTTTEEDVKTVKKPTGSKQIESDRAIQELRMMMVEVQEQMHGSFNALRDLFLQTTTDLIDGNMQKRTRCGALLSGPRPAPRPISRKSRRPELMGQFPHSVFSASPIAVQDKLPGYALHDDRSCAELATDDLIRVLSEHSPATTTRRRPRGVRDIVSKPG